MTQPRSRARLPLLPLLALVACSRGLHGSRAGAFDGAEDAVRVDLASTCSASAMERVVCDGRAPCRLEDVQDAGVLQDGAALLVATAGVAPRSGADGCSGHERWLVRSAGDGLRRLQLLAQDCVSSRSPAPRVTIPSPGHVRVQASEAGRASPPWERTVDLTLAPLAVDREEATWWTDDELCTVRRDRVDWRTFTSTEQASGAGCRETASVRVPLLELDASFVDGDWRTTSLGACATRIDGTPEHGWAQPAGPTSAGMWAVATPAWIFVEIIDDVFVTSGPVIDRLQYGYPARRAASELRTQLVAMDGAVRGAAARVDTVVVDDHTRRFRIENAGEAMLLAYGDTDDGTSEQTISTGEQRSLGRPWILPRARVECHASGGALQLDVKPPSLDPTRPVVAVVATGAR